MGILAMTVLMQNGGWMQEIKPAEITGENTEGIVHFEADVIQCEECHQLQLITKKLTNLTESQRKVQSAFIMKTEMISTMSKKSSIHMNAINAMKYLKKYRQLIVELFVSDLMIQRQNKAS